MVKIFTILKLIITAEVVRQLKSTFWRCTRYIVPKELPLRTLDASCRISSTLFAFSLSCPITHATLVLRSSSPRLRCILTRDSSVVPDALVARIVADLLAQCLEHQLIVYLFRHLMQHSRLRVAAEFDRADYHLLNDRLVLKQRKHFEIVGSDDLEKVTQRLVKLVFDWRQFRLVTNENDVVR